MVVDHASVADQFKRVDDDVLYLTLFYTVAHMLYQGVLAALEDYLAAVINIHHVSRPIDNFRIGPVQGVLNECRGRLLRIVVVAHGQGGAAHAQFAFPSWFRDAGILIVKDDYVGIAECPADGNGLIVRYLTFDVVIHAVQGNLYRAVEIGEFCLREAAAPDIELLGRKHLAGEPHQTEV